ncbi:Hint domain-containing protein [Roseovarius sp. MMSF_3281]|uniref:Hint domain-containing protein n=1 Tax=Roseovarius sp. MMSF_3281 TaxID=3046694 RepID=UPI00273FF305|nr:Hint domain-containing protein [Roseovarius sp. MMSF_3281]
MSTNLHPIPECDKNAGVSWELRAEGKISDACFVGENTGFTPGTMITTLNGKRAIEDLRKGDRILTRDRGFQPLLWSGQRKFSVTLNMHQNASFPIRIRAGALYPGLPDRDLVVSAGHRLLTTDETLVASVRECEALVKARDLVGKPGVEKAPWADVTYIQLLMEYHELILSDNAWTESLHYTPRAYDGHKTDAETQPLVRSCVALPA